MHWMRWAFWGSWARQGGGRVERCTPAPAALPTARQGQAHLWEALAPLGQVLLKGKVELQILQLTASKAALGFGWGFRRVFFQYLLG